MFLHLGEKQRSFYGISFPTERAWAAIVGWDGANNSARFKGIRHVGYGNDGQRGVLIRIVGSVMGRIHALKIVIKQSMLMTEYVVKLNSPAVVLRMNLR